MQLPNLDEATKTGLNELTAEEVSMGNSYAFNHEILCYGLQAVAHTYLMKTAKNISQGKISLQDFIKKYKIDFGEDGKKKFYVPVDSLKSDGIFFPDFGYFHSGYLDAFSLFNDDIYNRFMELKKEGEDLFLKIKEGMEYTTDLIKKEWKPSDLENKELIKQGIQFGKDMWVGCVSGFNKYKNGCDSEEMPAQPQKVTDLGEKLIEYYSTLISEPTPSK